MMQSTADDLTEPPPRALHFGPLVRSLRRARGLTQERLAARCKLSTDTVRRLEHGAFSPSLDTLIRLGEGLDLLLSTFFECLELGVRNEAREVVDMLSTRTPSELDRALRVLRALFDEPLPLEEEAA